MNIAVFGLVNLETTLKIESFPLEYAAVKYPFFGIGSLPSGVGLNVATALKTLGSEINFCSFTGTDLTGSLTKTHLEQLGMHLFLESMPQHPQSVILVDTHGQRAIHTDLKDIQDLRLPVFQLESALANVDAAVVCNINFARPALALARVKKIPIYTDLHAIHHLENSYDQDFLQTANIVFFSGEHLHDPQATALEAMQRFLNIQIIVVGMGANGALLLERNQAVHLEPAVLNPNLKSTIGAGDALFSSFVYFHCKLGSARAALTRAVLFASCKLSEIGGAKGFISESELEVLLAFG